MKYAALAVLVSGIGNAFAFRESLQGSAAFWLWLLIPTLLLALVSLRVLWQNGTLIERFTPRWGDLSIGALTASVLLVASWAARGALAPSGTTRQAWLYRVYLQLGDPETLQTSALLTACLLLTAAAEEIVWRGMVLDALAERFGSRRGWILAALAYALSLAPTLFALRDPVAGPNPLLMTAALGCGIVWGFLAARAGRLAPGIFSHMAFTYFSAVQFRWPGI
jgi:membrane protease YdiL (CAAX protease family)